MDHAISSVNVSVMKATPVSNATAVQMVTTGFLIAEVSQIKVRAHNTQNHLLRTLFFNPLCLVLSILSVTYIFSCASKIILYMNLGELNHRSYLSLLTTFSLLRLLQYTGPI